MKMKQTIAVLAGLLLAVNGFAQGRVIFANTSAKAVINSVTGSAAAPGVAKAGLYWTSDLGAVPNLGAATDDFALAVQQVGTTQIPAGNAVVNIATSAALAGVYLGGTVTITGAPGAEVWLQVRAWSAQYASYADAFNSGTALIGASIPMKVKLAVGTDPNPSISSLVNSFTITPVPEPSTVLLGLLGGLGAMVLLRRRS